MKGWVTVAAAFALVPAVARSESLARGVQAPLRLSLEQVLRMAQRRSEEVAIAKAGVARAGAEQQRARSEYFPQVSASASYDRTLASEFEGVFDRGAGEMPDFGEEFRDLPFGRENIYRIGLSLLQPLFAGGRIVARNELAGSARRSAEIAVSSSRASSVLDAAQGYYDAVLGERLVTIAEATLSQAERSFELARVGRDVGAQSEFDLLRARVAADNERPVVLRRRMERDLARLRLKQLLDLPPEREVILTDTLDDDEIRSAGPLAARVADVPVLGAQGARAPVRQGAALVEARQASLDLARSQRWPALSFASQYGRVGYPEDPLPRWSDFRTNWTVGLVLQIPIFTGGRIGGDIAAAEADLVEARARLRLTEELALLEARSAEEQLAAARAVWEAGAGTVEQARRAYEIAELRHAEGVSTQLELTDARLMLAQAEVNRARAARELQVARIRVTLLPNLPLVVTAGGPLLPSVSALPTPLDEQRLGQTVSTPVPQPATQQPTPSPVPGAAGGRPAR